MREVNDFLHTHLWPLSIRVADVWRAADGLQRVGEPNGFHYHGQNLLVYESEPTPGLKIAEFCGEVLFPYQINEVYDSLTEAHHQQLTRLGLTVDAEGRPEAIMDLNHANVGEHFKTLSSIKPLIKLMKRVEVKHNAWHYDHDTELANVRYHLEREGLPSEHAYEYYGKPYYDALAEIAPSIGLWRTDHWFEGQFVGHSLWAESPDKEEWYWISPVMARTDLARKKLRIGNLMMLQAMESAYSLGVKRINFGVDEMTYKSSFWNARRVYRPGLRRIGN